MWFRLAARLGMPLQAVQAATTSTEFLEWCEFLEWEQTEGFHRYDHYFAQLTAEVVRGRVKDTHKVKDDAYMIKFTAASKPAPSAPAAAPTKGTRSKADAKARLRRSKAAWGAFAGKKLN